MIIEKFRRLFKKASERRKLRNFKNKKEKNETIICFECKKPCNIKSEYHLLYKFKNKAMVTPQDDNDEESMNEEQ